MNEYIDQIKTDSSLNRILPENSGIGKRRMVKKSLS